MLAVTGEINPMDRWPDLLALRIPTILVSNRLAETKFTTYQPIRLSHLKIQETLHGSSQIQLSAVTEELNPTDRCPGVLALSLRTLSTIHQAKKTGLTTYQLPGYSQMKIRTTKQEQYR